MKNVLFIILIICFTSLSAFSQKEMTAAADWQSFAPENEEFSIEFPALPTSLNFPEKRGRRYYTSLNDTFFFISTDQKDDDSQYKIVLKFINQFQQNGKVKKLNGIAAESFSFADSENFYHTVLTAKTENRTYVFQTISPTADNPLVERFFANLKLTEKSGLRIYELLHSLPEPETSPRAGEALNSVPAKALLPPPPSATPQKTGDTGLTIQSKPRAIYTDLARFYGVNGRITLRVTFLAGGEIGSVTPVNRLPFGLTTAAVEAAKKLRFTPAVRDGQPYSVIKQVQYLFAIY